MSIENFFYEHPVFRHEEFVAWKFKNRTIQRASVNMALSYYLKTGQIIQIKRKLYAVVPPNQTTETILLDPYLIAAKSAPDAVLSYHTALELHGVSYSAFSQFTYTSRHKNKIFEFHSYGFQAVTQPIVLQKKQETLFGVQTINRQGLDIQITNLERTFVDALDRVELCGGWEEVCRALNNMHILNVDEVIEYCLLFENDRLTSKTGYFLEQRQGVFSITDKQLKKLFDERSVAPQYVSKRDHEKFQLIKKWNIFLPISVVKKSWEEPHVNL